MTPPPPVDVTVPDGEVLVAFAGVIALVVGAVVLAAVLAAAAALLLVVVAGLAYAAWPHLVEAVTRRRGSLFPRRRPGGGPVTTSEDP